MKQKNFIIFFLLIIFIFQFFKLPYSTYNLLKWDYKNRMAQNYGYCERESWGFYDYVIERFKLKDKSITVINYEGHVTLEFLFNFENAVGEHYQEKKKSDYFLITNFESSNDETIFDKFEDLKNYKVLYRYNNCYLLTNA
jgi:hypothetical protein